MSPDVVLGHPGPASVARSGASWSSGASRPTCDEGMGLSPAVAAAVDDAVDRCVEVLEPSLGRAARPRRRYVHDVRQPLKEDPHDDSSFRCVTDRWPRSPALVVKSLPDIARYLKMREM